MALGIVYLAFAFYEQDAGVEPAVYLQSLAWRVGTFAAMLGLAILHVVRSRVPIAARYFVEFACLVAISLTLYCRGILYSNEWQRRYSFGITSLLVKLGAVSLGGAGYELSVVLCVLDAAIGLVAQSYALNWRIPTWAMQWCFLSIFMAVIASHSLETRRRTDFVQRVWTYARLLEGATLRD